MVHTSNSQDNGGTTVMSSALVTEANGIAIVEQLP